MLKRMITLGLFLLCAACATTETAQSPAAAPALPLYPNETPEIRALIDKYAALYEVPSPLVHKVVQRESKYNPRARNGPYYGMMQMLPATARGMGFQGSPEQLLDAETNLKYGVKYLKGAWTVADGDMDAAVMWYARGYYYEAKNQCVLVETGLNEKETGPHCR